MSELAKLAESFAVEAHLSQMRKYTGRPYVEHVIAVSAIVAAYGGDQNQIVAALLHDTVEDTDTTLEQITELFGPDVAKLVEELTNVYDKSAYPNMNRAERKRLEAIRLGSISDRAQTIKYADFLNNGEDILVQDPKFAKVYLREMAHKLKLMTRGNPALRQHVITRVLGAI
jgi:(p)ppGpp synthase/HD superfamily hydrolase